MGSSASQQARALKHSNRTQEYPDSPRSVCPISLTISQTDDAEASPGPVLATYVSKNSPQSSIGDPLWHIWTSSALIMHQRPQRPREPHPNAETRKVMEVGLIRLITSCLRRSSCALWIAAIDLHGRNA